MADNILRDEIAEYVERLVLEGKETYLSACLDALDQFHLDYGQLAKLLSPALRSKLEHEATEQGLISGGSRPMVTF